MENKPNKTNFGKGTYEWVSKCYNIYEGCIYNCKYPCYARVLRRKTEEQWTNPIFKEKWFNQKLFDEPEGLLANVMCFSAHDIYPAIHDNCLRFIFRVLRETKNTILITSKANLESIKYLCEDLKSYQERIRFMITITSRFDEQALKVEPKAPLISERFQCVEYLNQWDWSFNVSVEPFLDIHPDRLIDEIIRKYPKVNTVWLGCNSRKNYFCYNPGNLRFIKKEVETELPQVYRNKIRLKNSFLDRLTQNEIRFNNSKMMKEVF